MKKFGKLVLIILGYAALFFAIDLGVNALLGRPFHFELYLVATSVLCGYLEFRWLEKKARITE